MSHMNEIVQATSDTNEIVQATSNTNEIVIRIRNLLDDLPPTPSDRILLRVPNYLRRVKNEAYEPAIISIGPYHRGKDHLAAMEEHKFRYLKLLKQRDESSIAKYIEALSELNERAKNSYEKRFLEERQPDDFLETMLVDGCFIVELIRKGVAENMKDDDPIFSSEMTLYSLKHDLLLLKNQLPFFILQELFDMTLLPNEESDLVNMIFRFFTMLPGSGYPRREEHNLPKVPIRHLLGLMHDNWLPSPQGVKAYLSKTDQEIQRTNDAKAHIRCVTELHEAGIKLSIDCGLISRKEASKKYDAKDQIRCATELHEAGIKFKRVEAKGCSIFDIKFAKGVLEIPKLTIEDRTESLLRNLIAYEQFWKDDIYHVIDYTKFMDCLINSNKDVELLRRSEIINNWLGDDEVVASMFNRLLDNVRIQKGSFYSEIYIKVNKYCSRKWNLWKAKLRHDYFNGPWALISFLAAVFLLLFTALQAMFSILSYHHS
ncbi:hypothetical protein K2173_012222 [Erythroxylum novogranatense]|uniref:Uncharacterized protein n=1 Tax=Erythroxylum novogranatense TaxID=1862640 RepID=A0AAV8T7I8_9ROSI|nr:hypothetical protein K2173_012222 [Erythroxylum novogranatense]